MRLTMESIIRAGYAAIGCVGILAMCGAAVSVAWLWSLLGLLLIVAVTPAVITIFAFLGAYFPDGQFIVGNIMRIGMFLTPVFWSYDGSGALQHAFYWWNPFTYFLDIARAPIVSGIFPAWSFAFCVTVSLILWALALALLGRFRKQVIFVL
jgi:lipopolysaccharide transport system permease protein